MAREPEGEYQRVVANVDLELFREWEETYKDYRRIISRSKRLEGAIRAQLDLIKKVGIRNVPPLALGYVEGGTSEHAHHARSETADDEDEPRSTQHERRRNDWVTHAQEWRA